MSRISGLFLAAAPEDMAHLPSTPRVKPVLLAYQIGPGPRLLRCCPAAAVHGGWLGVSHDGSVGGDPGLCCRQAVQECRARGASGLLTDWDRFERSRFLFTRRLGQALERAGLTLAVPEAYGAVSEQVRVLIPSALSGGSLEARLTEALERYGPSRVILALERTREDFILPCPSGRGTPLSPAQLQALRERLRPAVYWSGELCARYFTYRAEGQVHFVLFDDGTTLSRKLELAGRLGVQQAVGAWPELSDCLREVLPEG